MSCRRVLSSTPLLVRGSETVWGSGERKLTNKKYKYYKLLESGKQVMGPVPTQALVDSTIFKCQRPSFIPIQNISNIIVWISTVSDRLNRMVGIHSYFKPLVNELMTCHYRFWIFQLCHIFEESTICLHIKISSGVTTRRHEKMHNLIDAGSLLSLSNLPSITLGVSKLY
jgi:hypothetical protein